MDPKSPHFSVSLTSGLDSGIFLSATTVTASDQTITVAKNDSRVLETDDATSMTLTNYDPAAILACHRGGTRTMPEGGIRQIRAPCCPIGHRGTRRLRRQSRLEKNPKTLNMLDFEDRTLLFFTYVTLPIASAIIY